MNVTARQKPDPADMGGASLPVFDPVIFLHQPAHGPVKVVGRLVRKRVAAVPSHDWVLKFPTEGNT